MNIGLHTHARHSVRVVHAILTVNNKLLRDHMNDLPVGWQGNALGVFDQAVDVRLRHFMVRTADADNAATLEALDVIAGDSHNHGLDRHA